MTEAELEQIRAALQSTQDLLVKSMLEHPLARTLHDQIVVNRRAIILINNHVTDQDRQVQDESLR